MQLGRVLFWGALTASIGANAYLLLNDSDARPRVSRASSGERAAADRPGSRRPSLPPNAANKIPDSIARLDRTALEKRLATAEARLDRALPLEEKFDQGAPSSQTEAQARAVFDRIFEAEPGGRALYELECHEAVCKLDTDVSMEEWQQALFNDLDYMGLFSNMQVGDPTSYFRLEEPERVAGIQYFIKLMMALESSPALAACKQANPTKGTVGLVLKVEPATRRIAVEATGTLAEQGSGVCIRRLLEDLVATTPLPPAATDVPNEPYLVQVP